MISYLLSMMPSTKFYHVTQMILWMWSYDQSLDAVAFLWASYQNSNFIRIWPKNWFCEGWTSFKFSKLRLVLGVLSETLQQCSKMVKIKQRLIPTFGEVMWKNCWPLILNSVKILGDLSQFSRSILSCNIDSTRSSSAFMWYEKKYITARLSS